MKKQICYQCEKEANWLAPDGRCGKCTRHTTEEIQGYEKLAAAPFPDAPTPAESRPPVPTNSAFSAYVIRIRNRYFCGFDKAKRVNTAWSLAGAQMFLVNLRFPQDSKLIQAEEKLIAKNIKFDRLVVSLQEQSK